jgi:Ran GTPase-activating protein (RanGAP) involved in mRNA processing and transport
MKARAFIDWGESLLNRTPLRIVKLRDPKEHVAALADTRALERLEGLNLNFGKLGQTRSVAFLASPYLSNLRWLDLGNNSITQVGVEALCKAHPRLTNLRYLALDDDIVRPFGVGLLSHSPLLGQLEALNLDSNELDDEALRSLSQATRASQLVQLHLSRNSGITAGGLHELLASPNLASLRMVDANCCTLNHNALNQLRKAFGHRIEIDIMNWNARLGDGPVGKS